MRRPMAEADLAKVELDREELDTLLMHAQQQAAEQERMLMRISETMGDPAFQLGTKKQVERRFEMFQVLAVKLEQAAKEKGWR